MRRESLRPACSQTRPYPSQSGRFSSHHLRYSSIVSKERNGASSSTACRCCTCLQVWMKAYLIRCGKRSSRGGFELRNPLRLGLGVYLRLHTHTLARGGQLRRGTVERRLQALLRVGVARVLLERGAEGALGHRGL